MNEKLFPTAEEIFRRLRAEPGMQSHVPSLGVHAKRYEQLLTNLAPLITSLNQKETRILDVGPWWQTPLIRNLPNVKVDTLGLGPNPPVIDRPRSGERYFQQDLNKAVHEDYRADLDEYDIVIMAEVIEHLPIAPTHMLRKIGKHVKRNGYLVLTTPNGVSLKKRAKLLRREVPYTLISEDPNYPSHFREYTVAELKTFAASSGFKCVSHRTTDDWYWRYNPSLISYSGLGRLKNRLVTALVEIVGKAVPASMKQSIVMVLTH